LRSQLIDRIIFPWSEWSCHNVNQSLSVKYLPKNTALWPQLRTRRRFLFDPERDALFQLCVDVYRDVPCLIILDKLQLGWGDSRSKGCVLFCSGLFQVRDGWKYHTICERVCVCAMSGHKGGESVMQAIKMRRGEESWSWLTG
jgi:hypothetical protein